MNKRSTKNKIVLGIDAAGIRTGGSFVYLKNLLEEFDQTKFPQIDKIIVWGIKDVLDKINSSNRIEKVPVKLLESFNPVKLFLWKIYNQLYLAPKKCSILYVPGAIIFKSRIKKVVMFHNLLPFEYRLRRTYKGSFSYYKFYLLEKLYKYAAKHADGIIYPTRFAREKIEKHIKPAAQNIKVIYHSVGKNFKTFVHSFKREDNNVLRLLCVSFVSFYKGQLDLLDQIGNLAEKDIGIRLTLAGTVSHRLKSRFFKRINEINNKKKLFTISVKSIMKRYRNSILIAMPSWFRLYSNPSAIPS